MERPFGIRDNPSQARRLCHLSDCGVIGVPVPVGHALPAAVRLFLSPGPGKKLAGMTSPNQWLY
jgi:hypothetical protein